MATSWQQIWTGKLDAEGTQIDTGASAFGEFPFLRLIIDVVATGSNENGLDLRFNDDSTADHYPIRRSLNGAVDNTSLTGYTYWYNGYGGTDISRHCVIDIANEKDSEKMIYSNQCLHAGTFSSAPSRQQVWSKWTNADEYITDVDLSFDNWGVGAPNQKADADTKMTIFGGSDGTAVVPSLPNGSVFITSDTNVHYMFNSSAGTWNEVA